MHQLTMWNKFTERFLKIWKDPVWSKVIAASIIGLSIGVWARFTDFTAAQLYQLVIDTLKFALPVYLYLSAFGLYFLTKLIVKLFKRKSTILRDAILDEIIGNYTFEDIVQILSNKAAPSLPKGVLHQSAIPPNRNLLSMFIKYSTDITNGVNLENPTTDNNYALNTLCPEFVAYGLITPTKEKSSEGYTEKMYRFNENGKKLKALLDIFSEKYPEKYKTLLV